MKGCLALEDGRVFAGVSFGAQGSAEGEIVFNTSMTGYQEILTDPSYHGQIVAMTYPLIGNCGTNPEDVESSRPRVRGFVVREYCPVPSSHRSRLSLRDYLREHGIVALSEVDTRALTRHVRTAGAMRAVIASDDQDPGALVAQARRSPGLVGRDLVREVTCEKPFAWIEPCPWALRREGKARRRVVAYDFGMKYNILRYLTSFGCEVAVVPASTSAEAVLAMNPDGVFLSNGPGDPAAVPYAVESIRTLLGQKPLFGICLGHQVLALALGGKTYKLKFGHRGANQPVKDLASGRVAITSQNHGFAVDMESLREKPVRVTQINLNDRTVEGLEHCAWPAFSVQYHPEASPGPHDAEGLFGRFVDAMER
ncbi:MAG: glutamine-hydrolyzing carbamoyl-phosphate synthase small subunit [Planctomycetota bacterium]